MLSKVDTNTENIWDFCYKFIFKNSDPFHAMYNRTNKLRHKQKSYKGYPLLWQTEIELVDGSQESSVDDERIRDLWSLLGCCESKIHL